MAISLDKIEAQAPALLSLAKKASNSLASYGLTGQKAKVALVLDYSGSMSNEYRSGRMQKLAEKVLALATQLDDDGAIDFFVFDTHAGYLGEISLDTYKDSISAKTKGRHMGTTNYAEAFLAVRDHFGFAPTVEKRGLFGKTKVVPSPNAGPADEPVYALFLTDGAPDSKADAVKALTEVSTAPIFWKFLSIGAEPIAFLQKLDDLDARFVDNADYQPIGSVDSVGDDSLFALLMEEYPTWLAEVRAKGLIR